MNNKTNFTAIFFVLIAIVFNILGTVLLKYFAVLEKNLYLILFFVSVIGFVYLVRTISWLMIGKWYQLSYIYPLLSINYIFAFILGMLLFNEQFSVNKLIGSIIITTGVLILSLTPHKNENTEDDVTELIN